jgi:acetolactate synthase-1/3 small subunit
VVSENFEEIEANVTYSSAKPSRIDSFMKLIAPFGILESARTGLMALPRSPLYGPKEEEMLKEADDIVDASSLPPG